MPDPTTVPNHSADDTLPTEPQNWPKPVGIISIVWGSLGMLCGIVGVASLMAMPSLMKSAEQQLGPMPDVMKPEPIQTLLAGLGIIPPIVLLIAGIMTLGRKAAGRPAHLAYAFLSIVLGGLGMVVAARHQLDIMAWAKQNSGDKWAQQGSSPFAWVGLGCGAILTFAWPLFCLVWFGPMRKRPEAGYEPISV